MKSSHRRAGAAPFILFALLVLLSAGVRASALPIARDLAADGEIAATQGSVIVVFYSRADCRYCKLVSKNYLRPLLADPRYKYRVVVREIELDGRSALTTFDGRVLSHARLAEQEKIRFVPVVAFHGGAGRVLVEPLVGIGSADFYGGYLENALERALENANQSAKQ